MPALDRTTKRREENLVRAEKERLRKLIDRKESAIAALRKNHSEKRALIKRRRAKVNELLRAAEQELRKQDQDLVVDSTTSLVPFIKLVRLAIRGVAAVREAIDALLSASEAIDKYGKSARRIDQLRHSIDVERIRIEGEEKIIAQEEPRISQWYREIADAKKKLQELDQRHTRLLQGKSELAPSGIQ